MNDQQVIATIAGALKVEDLAMGQKLCLMSGKVPPNANTQQLESMIWHAEADAKYRVMLARAIFAESKKTI